MSADTHSVKAKVASDGPNEAPAAPEESDTQNPPQEKDTKALFKDAFDRAWNSTSEEILERHPTWSKWGHHKSDFYSADEHAWPLTVAELNYTEDTSPARGVSPATAMRVLEEMEREERELPDGTDTTWAHNAS